MPIYEYLCAKCDKPFEELVFSSETAVKCPRCHSGRVEKLLSVFAPPPSSAPTCAVPEGGCRNPEAAAAGCCGGGRCH